MANLKYGSSGEDVKKLQESLIAKGYDVGSTKADGVFGQNTLAAVKKYQKDNGLAVDGIAGQNTLGKLYGTTDQPATPPTATDAPSAPLQNPGFNNNSNMPSDTVNQANTILQQNSANKPGPYQSKWAGMIQNYLDQIQNREPFSYDVNSDALYQQYRDLYEQQGQMAMMDTMGQAAAMTGGYGNSYAQSVGQQMYNQHLNQLNEIVPELYQQAYNRYTQEGQDLYNMYSLAMDQENLAYDQYRDAIKDAQWQAEFDEDKRRYDQEWELTLEKLRNSGGGGDGNDGDPTEHPLDAFPGYVYEPIEHGMSEEQIRQLQMAAGLEVTGQWDADTEAAYIAIYGSAPSAESTASDDSMFEGWDAGMWEGYFATYRKKHGQAAAEEELNDLISEGVIPKNMVNYAAMGARGGSKGH